jgi:hypothetical protein
LLPAFGRTRSATLQDRPIYAVRPSRDTSPCASSPSSRRRFKRLKLSNVPGEVLDPWSLKAFAFCGFSLAGRRINQGSRFIRISRSCLRVCNSRLAVASLYAGGVYCLPAFLHSASAAKYRPFGGDPSVGPEYRAIAGAQKYQEGIAQKFERLPKFYQLQAQTGRAGRASVAKNFRVETE